MAVNEISGFLKYKDSSGDTNLLLPITTKDNVDGLDEIENNIDSLNDHVANNDIHFTVDERNKLRSIEADANKTVVDSTVSATSTNPVQNKAIKAYVDTVIPSKLSDLTADATHRTVTDTEKSAWNAKADVGDIPTVPTNVSAFTNDAGYLTQHQSLSGYAKTSDIPTKVSQLTNDSSFATESYVDNTISNLDMPSGFVAQPGPPADKTVLWVDTDDETDETANIVQELKKTTGLLKDVSIKSVSANLCDDQWEYGWINDSGANDNSMTPITVSFRTKNYIPVEGSRQLCWNANRSTIANGNSIAIIEYSAPGVLVKITNALVLSVNKWDNKNVTLNASTKYVRLRMWATVNDLSAIRLNLFYWEDREQVWTGAGDTFKYLPHYNTKYVGEFVPITKMQSPLTGKTIIYDGDSIAESRTSSANNGGGYAKLIADMTGSSYQNFAKGGARLTTAGSAETYHSVVDNVITLPKDGDLYCFEGGINDYWTSGKTLGTFSKTDFTGTLDANTICGALETIFRYALTNFIGKPVCFVITHKVQSTAYVKNSSGNTFEDYRNAMVQVCEKYSIPYYDAFTESGLNGWNSAQSNAYLTANSNGTADGTHPNEEGYKRYYVPQLISLFERIMPR